LVAAVSIAFGIFTLMAFAESKRPNGPWYVMARLKVEDEDSDRVPEAAVWYKLMVDGISPEEVRWQPFANNSYYDKRNKTLKDTSKLNSHNFNGWVWRDMYDREYHKGWFWVKVTKKGYTPSISKYKCRLRSHTHLEIDDTIIMEAK
jgi:hypothetical protein